MKTKQEIIDAIRKSAEENAGIPLGKKRFLKKNSITEYNYSKFWGKFSDAQKESGFNGGTFQKSYDEEFLLAKFVELIREIGRFPTYADFIMKNHDSSEFPSSSTFDRSIGNKKKKLKKILEYSKKKQYSDVIELCSPLVIEKSDDDCINEISGKFIECVGEVYIFKSGRYYKIGKTKDTVRRGAEIRVLLPEKLELIHSIRTDDPAGIEAYWHKRFQSKRKNGEWFDLNSMDIKAFKAWKKIV